MLEHWTRFAVTTLVVAFAVLAIAHAAPQRVDGGFSFEKVIPAMEVLEDPDGRMDFESVRASGDFRPAPAMGTNFGFTSSAWWVRFTLTNPGEGDRHVVLREDYPLIDHLELWAQQRDGSWRHTATGDRTAFSTREFAHRDFLFDLDVPSASERTYYVRAASGGPVDLSLAVYGTHALVSALSIEQLAYGAYYGGFIVLVLYNFFIFLIVRDRAFVFYLLYAISYGLYFAIHNGLAFQLLWPESPAWGNQALLVMLSFTLIFGMQFTRTFLDTAGFARRLDKLAIFTQWLAAIGLIASFFAPYATLILPISLLTVVLVTLILTLGTLGLVKGYRPARYFMIAWAMLLVGVLAYMLKVFGILPHNLLTQNGFQVGSLVEMVLLSLALASRVRELQRQSRTDTLTRVPNRRHFDEVASGEFERARRNNGSMALLVVDIDHFKQFNDRYGHSRGDEVLRQVAEKLSNGVRRGDHACRYGGEEFALVLPGADGTAAADVAESLRSLVESSAQPDAPITVSIGVATSRDREFANVDELFQAADRALYRAKDLGRNRVERYAG
ncbi:MAG: GGDEF domain-containing protein [Dokdonella sp.]|nr:GGDEF domain-containing protein [Dokdonella sp.]MCB1569536.1 GGDEF domain-containing protein [Xanthomonadales bacterium]MCB1573611.1 GGDEF domain-containing protein [Xanthomonadales bacterium]